MIIVTRHHSGSRNRSRRLFGGLRPVGRLLPILLLAASSLAAQGLDLDREEFDTTWGYAEIRHPDLSFEAMPSYSIESYAVEMAGLPGIPSCCPAFESGSGSAPGFAITAGRHITDRLRLVGSAGVALSSGSFSALEQKMVDGGNGGVVGTFEHRIDVSRTTLRLAPGAEYDLFNGLFAFASAPIRFTVGGSFEQNETILSPGNIRFENDRRARLEESGSIPDLTRLGIDIAFGLGYALPLDDDGGLALVPRAGMRFGLSEIVAGTSWRTTDLEFGLGIRIRRDRRDSVIVDTILTPKPIIITHGGERIVTVSTEKEKYVDTLGLQVVRTSTLVPLLRDLFYDEGSAAIPERYRRLTADEAERFDEELIDGEAFDVYYELLNVLGARMRRYPDATLTLTGCNTNVGVEKNNRELSRERAEGVRDYLVDVWSIAPERISVEARNLPSRPSPTRNEDGRSENRRVELSSSDRRLLDPVRTLDTAIRPDRSVIYFDIAEPKRFLSWQVEARQGSRSIMDESGAGTPPDRIPLVLASGAITVELTDEPITFEVRLTDASGTVTTEEGEVLVRREERTRPGAEAYWMVVFGYDKRTLDAESRRTLARIEDWIDRRNGYVVELVGQTDRTGNAEYNRRLSVARATAVVDELGEGDESMRGVGNAKLEYPNDLPEGRYYSRNVKIVTRTDDEE